MSKKWLSCLFLFLLVCSQESKALMIINHGTASAGADLGQTWDKSQPPSSFSPNVFYEQADLTTRPFGSTDSWHGWAGASWNVSGGNNGHIAASGWSTEGFNGAIGSNGWIYGRGHADFEMNFTLDSDYRFSNSILGTSANGLPGRSGVLKAGTQTHTVSAQTLGDSGGFWLDILFLPIGGSAYSADPLFFYRSVNHWEESEQHVRQLGGPAKVIDFTPENGYTIDDVANAFGYNHFNWVNIAIELPGSQTSMGVATPFIDPPKSAYPDADDLPFYWDEGNASSTIDKHLGSHISADRRSLQFVDIPQVNFLWPWQKMSFHTVLVGVYENGYDWDPLHVIEWSSNYTLDGGGVLPYNTTYPTDWTPDQGGIFGSRTISLSDLSPEERQLLIANGAQNIQEPIPEPGTLLLLTTGLLGMGGYSGIKFRKKRRKQFFL